MKRVSISMGDSVPVPESRRGNVLLRKKCLEVLKSKVPNLSRDDFTYQKMRLRRLRTNENHLTIVYECSAQDEKKLDGIRKAGFKIQEPGSGKKMLLYITGLPAGATTAEMRKILKTILPKEEHERIEIDHECRVFRDESLDVASHAHLTILVSSYQILKENWRCWSEEHKEVLKFEKRLLVQRGEETCLACWKACAGHIKKNCPVPVSERKCGWCGVVGHTHHECRNPRAKCLVCGDVSHASCQCREGREMRVDPEAEVPARRATVNRNVATYSAVTRSSQTRAEVKTVLTDMTFQEYMQANDERMSYIEQQIGALSDTVSVFMRSHAETATVLAKLQETLALVQRAMPARRDEEEKQRIVYPPPHMASPVSAAATQTTVAATPATTTTTSSTQQVPPTTERPASPTTPRMHAARNPPTPPRQIKKPRNPQTEATTTLDDRSDDQTEAANLAAASAAMPIKHTAASPASSPPKATPHTEKRSGSRSSKRSSDLISESPNKNKPTLIPQASAHARKQQAAALASAKNLSA
jgi:hypothetical protein